MGAVLGWPILHPCIFSFYFCHHLFVISLLQGQQPGLSELSSTAAKVEQFMNYTSKALCQKKSKEVKMKKYAYKIYQICL